MQKQLSSSFTQPLSVLTFESFYPPPPYSGYAYSMTKNTVVWVTYVTSQGINACLSVKDRQMHATQSQQSVLHMCYQTLTTTGKDQNLPFEMELNASRCPGLTGRKTLMSTYTMLLNTLSRIGKENTRCVFIVPPSFAISKNTWMDGHVSDVNIQIMRKDLMSCHCKPIAANQCFLEGRGIFTALQQSYCATSRLIFHS